MRTLPRLLALLAALCAAAPASAEFARSSLLVSYDFDAAGLPTGPDTFTVMQDGRGTVRLSEAHRLSGSRSLELHDVPGDGAFPDFLGHLPLRRDGQLFVHFAWMTTDPNENLNIGLLGPEWCQIVKDGISFWLATEDGTLFHVSDRASRPLFRPEPGRWYVFDLFYDIARGRYDLVVQDAEGGIVAEVREAPNPAGVPGSAVFKFSFAGDLLNDRSDVTYYVDDVVVSVDAPVARPPFVAPGRRQLFFERWSEFHMLLRARPGCLPALELADLGFTPRHVGALRRAGGLDAMTALLAGGPVAALPKSAADPELQALLDAAHRWDAGCTDLAKGRTTPALAAFRKAAELAPAARLYPLSEVFAHAGRDEWDAADDRLAAIYHAWQGDERLPAVMGTLGVARGDLEQARDWLHGPAQEAQSADLETLRGRLLGGTLDARVVAEVKKRYPERWRDPVRETLVADQYFFTLLWSGRERQAERYAHQLAHRQHALGLPTTKWMERAADASFALGELDVAQHRYHVALHENPHPTSPLLKLSDVFHAKGDRKKEREYREMVYGSLGTP